MSVFRWIVTLVAIALLITFGAMAASAISAGDGSLTSGALRPTVWAVITYLSVNLFLKTSK